MYKYVAIFLACLGIYGYHNIQVNQKYKQGKQEIQALWDRDKAVQNALAEEARLDQEQLLKETEKKLSEELQTITAKYNASRADVQRLRNELKSAALRRGSGALDPGLQCTDHQERISEIAGLLEEGVGLVDESRQRIEELEARLKALQDYVTNR